MKIRIDVDMTPQELRRFFGLPDVEKLQDELIEQVRRNMQAGAEGFDPASLLRPLMPMSMQSLEAMQKAFWEGLASAPRRGGAEREDDA